MAPWQAKQQQHTVKAYETHCFCCNHVVIVCCSQFYKKFSVIVRIAKALASYFSFNRYPELQSPEKTKRIAQNKHLTTSGFAVASSEKRRNILSDHLHLNQIKDKGAWPAKMLRNVYYTLNHMKEKGVQPVKVKDIMYTITLNQMKDKRVQPVIAAMYYICYYPRPNLGEEGTTSISGYALYM